MAELENETRIYVGLNDSETRKQKYSIRTYATVLKQVCYHYHVPFSFTLEQGGYFHVVFIVPSGVCIGNIRSCQDHQRQ